MHSMGMEALSMPGPKETHENEQNLGCVGLLSSCFKPHLALSSLPYSSSQLPHRGKEVGQGSQSPRASGAENMGVEQTRAFDLSPPPTSTYLYEQAVKKPLLGSVVSARSSQPQGL